jgi:predicted nucleic acid-binding protein
LTVLVDTNVILDIVTNDPLWKPWSLDSLNRLAIEHRLAINDVIFAELAPGFDTFEEVDRLVDEMGLALRPIPRAALFLAGKVHQKYRRRAGIKAGVLPDFFIGAQAAIEGLTLLTRDVGRFGAYFPTINLVTPDRGRP